MKTDLQILGNYQGMTYKVGLHGKAFYFADEWRKSRFSVDEIVELIAEEEMQRKIEEENRKKSQARYRAKKARAA